MRYTWSKNRRCFVGADGKRMPARRRTWASCAPAVITDGVVLGSIGGCAYLGEVHPAFGVRFRSTAEYKAYCQEHRASCRPAKTPSPGHDPLRVDTKVLETKEQLKARLKRYQVVR